MSLLQTHPKRRTHKTVSTCPAATWSHGNETTTSTAVHSSPLTEVDWLREYFL